MNEVIAEAIVVTDVNTEGRLSPDDLHGIND